MCRDSPARDQLTTRLPDGGADGSKTTDFPYQNRGRTSRLDGLGEVDDILLAEHHCQLSLLVLELSQFALVKIASLEDLELTPSFFLMINRSSTLIKPWSTRSIIAGPRRH